MEKPLDFPAFFRPLSLTSCVSNLFESFYTVYSSFWNLIPFFLPARLVSALDGLLSISLKLLTLSGILPFSINSFRLASLLALLIGLHLSFLIGALSWFIKITKVVPFQVFRKDLFFSLSSSMIFRLLCLPPSDALFAVTIWPFGPLRSPLQ